jgi:predicted double-glycine peptidase
MSNNLSQNKTAVLVQIEDCNSPLCDDVCSPYQTAIYFLDIILLHYTRRKRNFIHIHKKITAVLHQNREIHKCLAVIFLRLLY